ncbi:hypothetical protein [Paracoccus angustae]
MDVAALGFAIDSSGALKAANDLDKMTGAAKRADDAQDGLQKASERTSQSLNQILAAISKVVAAQDKGNAIAEKNGKAFDTLANNIAKATLAANTNATATQTNTSKQDDAAAAAARHAARLEELRTRYNPLYAASKQYEKALDEIAEAERDGALSAAAAATARQRAAQSMAPLNKAVDDGSDGLNSYAHRVTQASFQVQDFAVQVASGQSAMMAFTQQFPQFAGSLGASGKLALYGSLMGTAVAVTAAIVPHLISAGDAGKSLDEVMDSLADSMDAYGDAIESANAPLDDLIEKYGRAAVSARALLEEQEELRRVQAMQDLNAGADRIAKEVQGIFGGMTYRSASWTRELAEDLEITVDQMARLLQLNRELEGAQGPQAQAAAAAEMRDYFLDVYGTVDNIPPRLLEVYAALVDSGQAAMQFQALTEQSGAAVVELSSNATLASIEIWSMSDAASGLAGYFNAANAATGGLLGTLQSAATAAWDLANARVASERAAKQIAASQTNMDPLGNFSGGQGSAMRVQVAAGGVIRTPEAPTYVAPRGGGGRRKKSGGGGGGGGSAFDPFETINRDTELLKRQIEAVGKSEGEVARLQARWEAFDRIQKEGVKLTPEMTAKIEQQAAQFGSLTQQLADTEEAQKRFQDGIDEISETMADIVLSGDSLRESLANIFKGIAHDLMTSGIRQALMSQFSGTGGGGGIFGSLLGAAFGAVDPLAGALRGAGVNAIPSFDGGGWTPSGPRSGGLDGKSGFLALLHRGEQVIDTTKGQGMSGGFHVTASFDEEGNAYVKKVTQREIAGAAPQLVNRSVGATRRAMGKSKRGWGI